MSHNGLAHGTFRDTHQKNETPVKAILITGIAAMIPVAILAARADQRLGCIRLDGIACHLWIHRYLCADLFSSSKIFEITQRVQFHGLDHSCARGAQRDAFWR